MNRISTFFLLVLTVSAVGLTLFSAQKSGTNPVVEKLDPALDAIVPANAKLEILKGDYFGNIEGPLWVQQGQTGYLLFTDISANHIYKWTADGKLSIFLDKTGFSSSDTSPLQTGGYIGSYNGRFYPTSFGSNGITLDPEGRIVWCAQGDRAIVRLEKDGQKRTVLTDKYEGKRLNRPNDLVAKSDGWIYFTDPRSDRGGPQELDFSGVYRVKDGKLELLDKEVQPNGIAFTADEKTLYVGGSKIWRYDVKPDGAIANRKEFNPVGCDGMKVDRQGNIYCATTSVHGVRVISPQGKHLGTILTLEDGVGIGPTNLAFGDADGKTLYITIKRSLSRIRLNIPGVRANS
jgi:gluconolactonase